MTRHRTPLRLLLAVLAAFALLAAGCGDDDDASSEDEATEAVEDDTEATDDTATDDAAMEDDAATNDAAMADEAMEEDAAPAVALEGDLIGVFALDAGACADGAVSGGSYFRMLQPGGTLEEGPYIENFDSTCDDFTYSLLSPGTDGGLVTGGDQSPPDPAFDAAGNGLAAGIAAPVTFFGVDFAAATDPALAPITVTAAGDVLAGDTSAFTAYYGGEPFNQGSATPEGVIDPETGVYVLEWTSQIVGGAFNDFTGVWHLEGTFTPAG